MNIVGHGLFSYWDNPWEYDVVPWFTMLHHGWISYKHNICDDATSHHGRPLLAMDDYVWFFKTWLMKVDNDWPLLSMVYDDYHIETIFVIMWCWTMVETMIDFHIETIFVTMWCWTMVDLDFFSYWENLCHNVMLDHS